MQSIKEKLKFKKDNALFLSGLAVTTLLFIGSVVLLYNTFRPQSVDINLAETASSCTLQFSVGHTPDITDFTVEKTFKTLNGQDLGNTPVNPLEKVLFEIVVTNIGNTNLTNLTIDDPLTDEFIGKGAINLNLVKFIEFVENPQDKCVYSEQDNKVTCDQVSLLPEESFIFSFSVEMSENLGVSKDVINVVRVINNDDNTVKYDDDILITQVVSNVCDFDAGFCTQVLRDKLPDETSCISDANCTVETPKHFSCLDQACVLVDGEGTDKCSVDSDCSYSTCEDESCVINPCQNGNCVSSCSTDNDCKEPTRTICESKSCVEIPGEGRNECDEDSDCIYYTCNDNDQCISETCENGDCESSCDTDTDCEDKNYRVCRDESCVEVSGEGEDECDADIDCEILDYNYTDPKPQVPQTQDNEVYAIPETGIERSLKWFYVILFAGSLVFSGYLFSRKFKS